METRNADAGERAQFGAILGFRSTNPYFGYKTPLGTSPWASPVREAIWKLNLFVGLCIHRKKYACLTAMNVFGRLILLAGLVITSTVYALESKLSYAQLFGGSIALILIVFVLFSND